MDGTKLTAETLRALSAFFEPRTISWKPQSVNQAKTEALAVAYVDARDVMRRLDLVVGGDWDWHWEPDGDDVHGFLTVCGVTREDVGEMGDGPQGKSRKAAVSDALKRCAVHFGVGRYLYYLPAQWCPFDGKRFTKEPELPKWALPGNEPKATPGPAVAVDETTGEVVEPAQPEQDLPDSGVRVGPSGERMPHWIDNDKVRARWWAYTGKTLGLTNDEVHQALGVEHMAEYTGSMMDAKQAVNRWMGERVSVPTPQPVAEETLPF